MKKISVALLILVIFSVAGYYLWQNRHKYFFKGESTFQINEDNDSGRSKYSGEFNDDKKEDPKQSEEDSQAPDKAAGENEALLEILEEHCDNRCEDKKGTNDYKYCLEICGLNEDANIPNDSCEEIANQYDKDVCFKRQALKNKDIAICEKIEDSRLEDNCRNRILEDILEHQ